VRFGSGEKTLDAPTQIGRAVLITCVELTLSRSQATSGEKQILEGQRNRIDPVRFRLGRTHMTVVIILLAIFQFLN
jgi:hypothetical protein